MTVARITVNGRGLTAGLPPTGTAPGQVGSLAPGTPTVYTIPVTYTAASGASSYAGYTSPHGAATWTPNSGTFGATGGTFVGLMPATDYDVEIVATNTFGSSTTQYLAGVTTQAAPPAFTGAATRFDLVPSAGGAVPGSAITIQAIPNGTWGGQTLSLAISKGAGTLGASSLATTNGSAAAVSFTYTPTSGTEHEITATNSGSLFNPDSLPLASFSPSSGTARTLAANLYLKDMAVHQWQWLGTGALPLGFGGISGATGGGRVWLEISAIGGATDGLFARFYDAHSTGATATAGTGTQITSSPVKVYGAVSATGEVRLLLPAISDALLYMDIATDSAMTNPVRIAQRFKVGTVWIIDTRSQKAGYGRGYPENGTTSFYTTYAQSAVCFATANSGTSDGSWYRNDLNRGDPYPAYSNSIYGEDMSQGNSELGRITLLRQGCGVGVIGVIATGGGIEQFLNSDGSPTSTLTGQIQNASRGYGRYLLFANGGHDSGTETAASDQTRYAGLCAWVGANIPGCAVVAVCAGQTGTWGGSGSAMVPDNGVGYTRNQVWIYNNLEGTDNRLISSEDHNWNQFTNSNPHATNASKVQFVREDARLVLSAEMSQFGGLQTRNRGPVLSQAGTRATGSADIMLPIKFGGGTTLHATRVTFSDGTTGPTGALHWSYGAAPTTSDLMHLFAVYPSGGYYGNGSPLALSAVAFDFVTTPPTGFDAFVKLTLASVPSGAQTVHFAADYSASGGQGNGGSFGPTYVTVLCNDNDPFGYGIGCHARPAVDIAISVV